MLVTVLVLMLTHMRNMKVAVATLPLTRPTWVLYTSTLVAPVARMLETRIMTAMAAMLAPRMTKASCVGSTHSRLLST